MKRPELIIFDVDGLMINTEFLWKEAYEEVAKIYNAPEVIDEFFINVVGLANVEYQKAILAPDFVERCNENQFLYLYKFPN